jgi:S-adenosylmethionine-dependent methyltransferase
MSAGEIGGSRPAVADVSQESSSGRRRHSDYASCLEHGSMSEKVKEHYEQNSEKEWRRLESGLCQVEFRSTLRLIDEHFPKTGHIGDIGSGPGRYSIELLKRGYRVTLFDLSPRLLESAKDRVSKSGYEAEGYVAGNATDLSTFSEGVFDSALFLGPCYHLVDKTDRLNALKELARVLRPNGRAIIAYLNSWGILRTGVVDFPHRYRDLEFLRQMVEPHLIDGRLSAPTVWHWTVPDLALSEVESSGLSIVTYAGAEGFLGGMSAQLEDLKDRDPDVYETVLDFAVETAELPQYRDATDHLHIVAMKR